MKLDDLYDSPPYGENVDVILRDGSHNVGILVDIDLDWDGSYGCDELSIKKPDGTRIVFSDYEVERVIELDH